MREKITIYQPWGGLGDNLAHTTIPYLCKQFNIKCYLSKQNAYRNKNIKSFVWDKNPYMLDEVDSTDLTWCQELPKYEKIGKMNHIEALQIYHGFDPIYHYPLIYYTPEHIPALKDKTLIDLSAYTTATWYKPAIIKSILNNFALSSDTLTVTHSNLLYECNYDLTNKFNAIDITSIEYYADVLASCKRFITFHSGQATLASTIKHITSSDIEIFVITPDRLMPENAVNYSFKNTTYVRGD